MAQQLAAAVVSCPSRAMPTATRRASTTRRLSMPSRQRHCAQRSGLRQQLLILLVVAAAASIVASPSRPSCLFFMKLPLFLASAYAPARRITTARGLLSRHSHPISSKIRPEEQLRRDSPLNKMPSSSQRRRYHRASTTALSFSASPSPSTNANELFPLQRGSSVALVTPFDAATGNVDMASLDRLLEYHLNAGTNNLCILGTTGEASLLSMDERRQILVRVVDKVKGRMCILAGTGTINPNEIRAMTQQAIDVGCDASLVVTPYYVKPPQRGLVAHMVSCAEMGLPVCMYNVPGRTGVNMLDESLALAAELHPGIAAVKDATGDLRRLQQLRGLTKESRPDLLLYSGDDATSLDFVLQGGDGCISVTANVAASEMAIMMKLALQGRTDEARTIDNRLAGLHKNLFLESNPIPVKWAVQRLGLIESAYCRPPLATFDEATLGVQLEESIYQAGLLE